MPNVHFADLIPDDESAERDKSDTQLDAPSAQSHTLVRPEAATKHSDIPGHAPSPLPSVVVDSDVLSAACTTNYKANCGNESSGLGAGGKTGSGSPCAQLSHSVVSKTDSNQDQTTEAPVHCKPVLDAEWCRRQLTDVDCFDRESVKHMRLGPDYSIVCIDNLAMYDEFTEEGIKSRDRLEKEGKLNALLYRNIPEDDICYRNKLVHAGLLSLSDGTLHKQASVSLYDRLIKFAVPTDKLIVFKSAVLQSDYNEEEWWQRWVESVRSLTEYTSWVKAFRPEESPNKDCKASRYPAKGSGLILDGYSPQVIFATDHIPTSKILQDEDIPAEFLRLMQSYYR